jgi:hypothetical protein
MNRKYVLDLAERVGATAAEAGIAVAITELSGQSVWWAVLAVPALAAAKGWLARYTGDPGSASLLRRPRKRALPAIGE